jgi:hypothetical protein
MLRIVHRALAPMTGSCIHANKPSGSIKDEFLDKLSVLQAFQERFWCMVFVI